MTGQERQAQVRHIPILVEGRQELVRYSWSVRYQDSQPDRATTTAAQQGKEAGTGTGAGFRRLGSVRSSKRETEPGAVVRLPLRELANLAGRRAGSKENCPVHGQEKKVNCALKEYYKIYTMIIWKTC